jgi:putative ABC transport system permease protein
MPDSDGLHAFMIKFMAVKVAPGDLQGTIAAIQNIWNQEVTDRVFEYTFLDESINALYESEASFEKVISLFSGLAILLACLGLFGLTAYAAERRTKEIGIRKVLGASVGNVVALLSRDFLLLILIAAAIALPIAWWGMNTWLSDFAYRIDIAWWVFALAGIGAMLVALVTVSFQAIRAAIANPVESLRSE